MHELLCHGRSLRFAKANGNALSGQTKLGF